MAASNAVAVTGTNSPTTVDPYMEKLETARYLIKVRQTKDVQELLVSLLGDQVPEEVQKLALLEMAKFAEDQDDLPRSQQIYEQFLNRWPDAPQVPEVLLSQGRNFRRMGMHDLALTKFYAVMTAALTLKSDQLDYYEHLVVQAQIEIAQTHYSLGEYSDSIRYLSRLYNQNSPEIDKPEILYELVRCYSSMTNYEETVAGAQSFIIQYPKSIYEPEVRFDLATALKELGRNNDSLEQVLTLLQEQSSLAPGRPDAWAYWRERAGNLIANQFYREGDYPRALDVYTSLSQLDASPQWQLPVWYQIGMTYEHLMQPGKAIDYYNQIIASETNMGTNAPVNLSSIADMAHWRIGFIQWQTNAEVVAQHFATTNAISAAGAAQPINHD
ncbi:MAG: tetratricopeptide repeat protein [Limisphaerales bacterium]